MLSHEAPAGYGGQFLFVTHLLSTCCLVCWLLLKRSLLFSLFLSLSLFLFQRWRHRAENTGICPNYKLAHENDGDLFQEWLDNWNGSDDLTNAKRDCIIRRGRKQNEKKKGNICFLFTFFYERDNKTEPEFSLPAFCSRCVRVRRTTKAGTRWWEVASPQNEATTFYLSAMELCAIDSLCSKFGQIALIVGFGRNKRDPPGVGGASPRYDDQIGRRWRIVSVGPTRLH